MLHAQFRRFALVVGLTTVPALAKTKMMDKKAMIGMSMSEKRAMMNAMKMHGKMKLARTASKQARLLCDGGPVHFG